MYTLCISESVLVIIRQLNFRLSSYNLTFFFIPGKIRCCGSFIFLRPCAGKTGWKARGNNSPGRGLIWRRCADNLQLDTVSAGIKIILHYVCRRSRWALKRRRLWRVALGIRIFPGMERELFTSGEAAASRRYDEEVACQVSTLSLRAAPAEHRPRPAAPKSAVYGLANPFDSPNSIPRQSAVFIDVLAPGAPALLHHLFLDSSPPVAKVCQEERAEGGNAGVAHGWPIPCVTWAGARKLSNTQILNGVVCLCSATAREPPLPGCRKNYFILYINIKHHKYSKAEDVT